MHGQRPGDMHLLLENPEGQKVVCRESHMHVIDVAALLTLQKNANGTLLREELAVNFQY